MRIWLDSIENEEINPDEIICELYAEIDEDILNWHDDKDYFFSNVTLFTEEGKEVTEEELRLWTGEKSVENYLYHTFSGEKLMDEIYAYLRGEQQKEEDAKNYWMELENDIRQGK